MNVLKFFHSNVEIPAGLARVWFGNIMLIDYTVANNSHLVKDLCLHERTHRFMRQVGEQLYATAAIKVCASGGKGAEKV